MQFLVRVDFAFDVGFRGVVDDIAVQLKVLLSAFSAPLVEVDQPE